MDTSSAYTLDKVLQGHQRWVWDMAYSADSAYLVSGELICRGRRTEEWRMLTCVGGLTASSDHTARLWELASGTTVRQVSCCESESEWRGADSSSLPLLKMRKGLTYSYVATRAVLGSSQGLRGGRAERFERMRIALIRSRSRDAVRVVAVMLSVVLDGGRHPSESRALLWED